MDLRHDLANPPHAAIAEQVEIGRPPMLRNLSGWIAVTALLLAATATFAAPVRGKAHVARRWHGYGFLPGYRTPERIEAEQARNRGPVYWYGGPGFYRGRWNGGGFGPCWTQTPIGNVWNCGK
jgi:hypothetical protein